MLTINTPDNSFVRFDGENTVTHCIHGSFTQCLPVFAEADVAFQFVVEADTIEEANALCSPYNSNLQIGLVRDCEQEAFDVEFAELPDRYRISDLQVLYNWPHGFPGMLAEYAVGECFYIRVVVEETTACSNCFERIGDDCFSSVVEYGNDENFAGFNYCNSGGIDTPDGETCEPTVIEFTNVTSLSIPYITSMQDKYGPVPTVQVWIYDGSGDLVNMGVVATFDAMPPTVINIDTGGLASGIVVIR